MWLWFASSHCSSYAGLVHQRLHSQLVVTALGRVTGTQTLSAMAEKWVLSWLYVSGHKNKESGCTWQDWVLLSSHSPQPLEWDKESIVFGPLECSLKVILQMQRNREWSCSEVAGGCLDTWPACTPLGRMINLPYARTRAKMIEEMAVKQVISK